MSHSPPSASCTFFNLVAVRPIWDECASSAIITKCLPCVVPDHLDRIQKGLDGADDDLLPIRHRQSLPGQPCCADTTVRTLI